MRDVADAWGEGIPEPFVPDARGARLRRLRKARSWGFSGPVDGFAAARIAGFEPVGQVFGTTVAYPGPPGLGRCFVPHAGGAGGAGGTGGDRPTSADPGNPLLAKLDAARRLALERAVEECRLLGGDGIIGMRMSATDFLSDCVEFTVSGTAVRARSLTRPPAPFTTHVSGQDLARLLQAGWMPFAFVFGLALAACHFDDSMIRQTQRRVGAAGNREVSGYTRLANDARREARTALHYAVRELRGEGAVAQETTLHFSERECPLFDQRTDYIAEATILGSALVSLEPGTSGGAGAAAQPAPLTVMRLDPRPESVPEPQPGPEMIPRPSLGDRAFAYWSGRRHDS